MHKSSITKESMEVPIRQKLAITYHPLDSLILNPKNPRIHSKKQISQIANSIKEFGFNVPVLIDGNRQIIAGHGRAMACKELGWSEVPTICLDHLTKAQAKAFLIADNKLTENAQWDTNLLAQNFKELSELNLDFNIDITGFEMGEIDMFIEGIDVAPEEDEKELLAIATGEPISKTGDLWLLGSHRILCTSSLEKESFSLLMQKKQASMVFIDPPYNVPIDGHVSGLGSSKHREFAMASGEMTPDQFTDFLSKSLQMLADHSVNGSIHFICMDWRHMQELLTAGSKVYGELKNLCVWVKDNAGMGSFYRSKHELVFVYKKAGSTHQNNFLLGQHGRYRTNVWEYPGSNSFSRNGQEGDLLTLHPTVKPVAMVADSIMDCSRRGEIILDSFLGSGTTLIAAERTGRVCYGMEIDPLYIDTAIRRWQLLTGKKAVHAESGKIFDELMKEVSKEDSNA